VHLFYVILELLPNNFWQSVVIINLKFVLISLSYWQSSFKSIDKNDYYYS